MQTSLTVATRKSQLALAQCRAWTSQLSEHAIQVVELHVTTTGDRVQDRSLNQIGGKGLFIKEIEEALLDERADFAVHSLKDVPYEVAPGLVLGCISLREDPRDALITRTGCEFSELPSGCKVGTSSLRRLVQLRAWRPDLDYVPLRGNVDTRIRRCREGTVEAVVLASAGLRRLGLADQITESFDPERCLPAVGQGALAVEQRVGDEKTASALAVLNHGVTQLAISAERGVMKAVEGNCQVPVAALATQESGQLRLRGFLATPDGTHTTRDELAVPWPATEAEAESVGLRLGSKLREAL